MVRGDKEACLRPIRPGPGSSWSLQERIPDCFSIPSAGWAWIQRRGCDHGPFM